MDRQEFASHRVTGKLTGESAILANLGFLQSLAERCGKQEKSTRSRTTYPLRWFVPNSAQGALRKLAKIRLCGGSYLRVRAGLCLFTRLLLSRFHGPSDSSSSTRVALNLRFETVPRTPCKLAFRKQDVNHLLLIRPFILLALRLRLASHISAVDNLLLHVVASSQLTWSANLEYKAKQRLRAWPLASERAMDEQRYKALSIYLDVQHFPQTPAKRKIKHGGNTSLLRSFCSSQIRFGFKTTHLAPGWPIRRLVTDEIHLLNLSALRPRAPQRNSHILITSSC